jgi:hypothetical protein
VTGATAVSGAELAGSRWTPASGGRDRGGAGNGIGGGVPPYDFSDSFYRRHGLDPSRLVGRVSGADGRSIVAATADPRHRNVRVVATNAGFGHDGGPLFFVVFAGVRPSTFLAGSAGGAANRVADEFSAFTFPRASGVGRRQDDVFDTRPGFFARDPLAIWRRASVAYTGAALTTSAGRRALAAVAARCGTDLDGTPMIRTAADVESLGASGFVTVTTPAADGSAGPPWCLCPILREPAGGSIAPDASLAVTLKPDGTALVPELPALFHCLQNAGRTC